MTGISFTNLSGVLVSTVTLSLQPSWGESNGWTVEFGDIQVSSQKVGHEVGGKRVYR